MRLPIRIVGNEADWMSVLLDRDGNTICTCEGTYKEAEQNAATLAIAVNSHEALREALADIHDILSDILEDPDVVLTTQRYTALCAIQKSRQALALADGKEQP